MMQITEIPLEKFATELAYHEAAHYVVGLIAHLKDPGFLVPEAINFYVKDGEKYLTNVVMGISVSKGDEDAFFKAQPHRPYFECLKALAGFCSYNCFVNKADKRFLRVANLQDENDILTDPMEISIPFTPKDFWDVNTLHPTKGHDFTQTLHLFKLMEINESKRYQTVEKLMNDLRILLSNPNVRKVIEIVKDKLLEINGSTLKGDSLKVIEDEVRPLIEVVNLYEYLENPK